MQHYGRRGQMSPICVVSQNNQVQNEQGWRQMTTNGITLQVAKTTGVTAAEFHADMAERWQRLTVKTGRTPFGKTFIPFEK
jgi:phage regulator Rha-like protein